jgi:predicted DNA-binding antitoxin AbrB/MazE fold protein
MRVLKAHIRSGQLVVDEPIDLPEGAEVRVALVEDELSDEVLAGGGDHLDDEERRRLHESIDRGIADVRGGRTVEADRVIAKLRARTAER